MSIFFQILSSKTSIVFYNINVMTRILMENVILGGFSYEKDKRKKIRNH